ncbi:MAG: hypothetical protein QM756_43775 [Polyangiaceae bacterium]
MALTFRAASVTDVLAAHDLLQKRDSRSYELAGAAGYVDGFEPGKSLGWLCFDGERPVGLSMLYLRRVVAGGKTFKAGYWGNLFVDPPYRKAMVYPRLPLHMFRGGQAAGLDFMWTCSRRGESASVHLSLGCAELGSLPVLAKPLRPAALLWRRRELPPRFAPVARVPDALFRSLNHFYTAPNRLRAGVESLALSSSEFAALAALRDDSCAGFAQDAWDADGLRERLAKTLELDPYEIVVTRKQGRIVSWVAFRMALRGGFKIGALMDLHAAPGHEWALRSALVEAERRIERAGGEVVLHLDGISGTARSVLKGLGYVRSPETYSMMIWPGAFAADHPELRSERWRFSFIDHDSL